MGSGLPYLPPTYGIAEALRRLGGVADTADRKFTGVAQGFGARVGDVGRSLMHGAEPDLAPPAPHAIEAAVAKLAESAHAAAPVANTEHASPVPSEPARDAVHAPRGAEEMGAAKEMLRRGSFSGGPSWGGDGPGGIRSGAQMLRDLDAHRLINAEYEQGVGQNNREAEVRGDPLSLANAARRKTLEYEALMPAGDQPRLRVDRSGGGHMMDFPQDSPADFPLRGDVISIDRANALADATMKPSDRIAVGDAQARQVSMEKIRRAMQAGQTRGMTPEQIGEYLRPIIDVEAKKGALAEGDYKALSSLLYPNAEAAMAQQGPGAPLAAGGDRR